MTVDRRDAGRAPRPEADAWVDRAVVREFKNPISPVGGLVALFGSLAPNGAILKRSAADPTLFEKEGRAVVFTSLDDMAARVDSPELDIKPDDFMVLQNAGPKSGYAMPEAGYLPIPQKLARAGAEGHGAHLGRAHERHRVRHHRAARLARGGDRRRARAGEERRSNPALGEGPEDRSAGRRGGTAEEKKRLEAPGHGTDTRLREALHGPRAPGRARLRLRLPAGKPSYFFSAGTRTSGRSSRRAAW